MRTVYRSTSQETISIFLPGTPKLGADAPRLQLLSEDGQTQWETDDSRPEADRIASSIRHYAVPAGIVDEASFLVVEDESEPGSSLIRHRLRTQTLDGESGRQLETFEARFRTLLAGYPQLGEILAPLLPARPVLATDILDRILIGMRERGHTGSPWVVDFAWDVVYLKQSLFGSRHVEVGRSLHNLGRILLVREDYAGAQNAFEASAELAAPGSVEQAQNDVELAMLHGATGSPEERQRALDRAGEVWPRLGWQHASAARALTMHGNGLKNAEEQLACYRVAGEILADTHGELGLETLKMLVHIGIWHVNQRNFDRGLSIYNEAANKLRESYGSEHPWLARIRHNAAVTHEWTGDYLSANRTLEETIGLLERSLGSGHPDLFAARFNLSRMRWWNGDLEGAIEEALIADVELFRHLRKTARIWDEGHGRALIGHSEYTRDLLLSLSLACGVDDRLRRRIVDRLTRSRAVVLDEHVNRTRALARLDEDDELQRLKATLARAKNEEVQLSYSFSKFRPANYRELRFDAQRASERAERAVAQRVAELVADDAPVNSPGLPDVLESLPDGAALVSYVQFRHHSPPCRPTPLPLTAHPDPRSHGIRSYAAVVFRHGSEPAVVPLDTEDQIDGAIKSWRKEVTHQPSGTGAMSRYIEVGGALRRILWDPIEWELGDEELILVVPAGRIAQVSFATLPAPPGMFERPLTFLAEGRRRFHYLMAERDLTSVAHDDVPRRGNLIAFGRPSYSEVSRPTTSGARGGRYSQLRSSCLGDQLADLVELQHDESEDVIGLAYQVGGPLKHNSAQSSGACNPPLLVEDCASEAAFKSLSGEYSNLHISAHGFYLDDCCADGDADCKSENPLLRSGILLAGAAVPTTPDSAHEDGILSAAEVATLDLSRVDWAVLSACSSGLGEISSGEGPVGLRRAFRMAGVRTLVTSLWPVDDAATRDWMLALYDARLRQRAATDEAVAAAHQRTLARRRQEGRSTHPFYWGAFVAEGDWR